MNTDNNESLTITITTYKGGAGKTEVLYNAAHKVAKEEPEKTVIIVNVDNQKTLEFRHIRRAKNKFKDLDNLFFDNCTAGALEHTLKVYQKKYDYVFIDVAANFHSAVVPLFVHCDLIYFIFNPSKACTEVMPAIVETIKDTIRYRSTACVYKSFYNKVSPLPHVAASQIAESNTELSAYASVITPCDFSIAYRSVYEKCSKTGESITERKVLKSDVSGNKAKAEIAAFYEDFKKSVEQIKNAAGDSNE